LIQPILGQLHHVGFAKTGGRTGVSYGHIWLGRIIITLGIINGGLGFKLANNTNTGPIIYTVVAVIFYVAYMVSIFIGERRRKAQLAAAPPKYQESSPRGSAGATSPGGYYGPSEFEMEPNRRRMGGRRSGDRRSGGRRMR